MIDLHSHVLPGIDDGPVDMEGSVALARAARRAGTRVLVATPHLREDHPAVRPTEIADRCRALDRRLRQESIDLAVVPGAEIDLLWALDADDETLRLASYAQHGTYLLIETPYNRLPENFEDLLFRLALRRFRVLLAHPERNPSFQQDPARAVDLARRGVLLQLTARSLLRGRRGSRTARLAHHLLAEGAVHVIASDAHDAGPHRSPDLSPALAAAARVDRARARWMVSKAPAAILAGESLPDPPPRRGWRERLGLRSPRGRRAAAETTEH